MEVTPYEYLKRTIKEYELRDDLYGTDGKDRVWQQVRQSKHRFFQGDCDQWLFRLDPGIPFDIIIPAEIRTCDNPTRDDEYCFQQAVYITKPMLVVEQQERRRNDIALYRMLSKRVTTDPAQIVMDFYILLL